MQRRASRPHGYAARPIPRPTPASAQPLPVMQTVYARTVTPRCHARCEASVTPTPPAERRSGHAADLLPGIQQNHRFTGRRTRLPVPRRRACGRTSTSSRCKIGIKHCGKPDVRPHTRRPPLPRLAHAACAACVAPSPPCGVPPRTAAPQRFAPTVRAPQSVRQR